MKTLWIFSPLFSRFPELFHYSFEVTYEAQRKQWADLVKVSEMHYASTRYQPTVSLTAMVIKNAALSHLKGIWVTDILINKVPISQHQVCSLHSFSLLEGMEIRCPLPQRFRVELSVLGSGDSSQGEPYMENYDLPHFRSKKIQRKELQRAGWGSQSTWVTKNGHQTLEFIKIYKPGNEWVDGKFRDGAEDKACHENLVKIMGL